MDLRKLAETRIVIDESVCSGKPRIKGTRITVSDILLSLAEGMSQTDLLRSYRGLQQDDIQAALAYAFCVSDGIKPKIGSAFDEKLIEGTSNEIAPQENQDFALALEAQAALQEDLTKEKIAEVKAKKAKKTKEPIYIEKQAAPQERPYDLLIDISGEAKTKIFGSVDHFEQGLDMKLDNYVFETRSDGKPWLCYSTKDGIEIDQAMRRNLLVTYSHNGLIKKAVFEGYLTTDRQHKIFIQREGDKVAGKAL